MATQSDQPPADDRAYEIGSFEAELFWQKNRSKVLIGGIILLAFLVAVAIWFVSQHSSQQAAESLFAQADDPAGWREVIAKYPGSRQAADACLLLADALREQGKLEESSSEYQKFLANFPKSSLAGGARLGLAENLAVAGKTDEALAALRSLQEQNAGSYAAPFAALLEGRLLIRLGKFEEARKVFSNVASSYPQSPAGRAAGAQLDAIVPFLPGKPPETVQ